MTRRSSEIAESARARRDVNAYLRAIADRGGDQFDFDAMLKETRVDQRYIGPIFAQLQREGVLRLSVRKVWRFGKRHRERVITFPDDKVVRSGEPSAPRRPPANDRDRAVVLAYLRGLVRIGAHLPPYESCAAACGVPKGRFIVAMFTMVGMGIFKSETRRRGSDPDRYLERRVTFPDGSVLESAPYQPKSAETAPPPRLLVAAGEPRVRVANPAVAAQTFMTKYNGINLPDAAVYPHNMVEKVRLLRQYGDDVALPKTRGIIPLVFDDRLKKSVPVKDDSGWLMVNNILHAPCQVDARVERARRSIRPSSMNRPQTVGLVARYGRG